MVARGPDLIGMEDMGPQAPGARGFDIEAALGRKGEGENIMVGGLRRGKDGDGDGDGDTVVTDAEGEGEGESRGDSGSGSATGGTGAGAVKT